MSSPSISSCVPCSQGNIKNKMHSHCAINIQRCPIPGKTCASISARNILNIDWLMYNYKHYVAKQLKKSESIM